MLVTIPFKDVVNHLVAFFPGIVNVEIGWAGTFRIEETLEIQIKLNRINIGDTQTIGHHAVGTAAAAHVVKTARHGIADHIPGDEKIGRKAKVINDGKLIGNPFARLFVVAAIAIGHPIKGQLVEQGTVVASAAGKGLSVFDG